MKPTLVIIILLVANEIGVCQNLLNNADFETYTLCPSTSNQFNRVSSWRSIITTPDYFNCTFAPTTAISTNGGGYSGLGYIGIATIGDMNGSAEAVGQLLQQPLIPNTIYEFKVRSKRPNKGVYANNCGGIELYGFKNNLPAETSLLHTSQLTGAFLLASTSTITDTIWSLYTTYFTVQDTFNYIVVTLKQEPSCSEYVFIDDCILWQKDTLFLGLNNHEFVNLNFDISIFPNPSNDKILVEFNKPVTEVLTINIFSTLGQQVYETNMTAQKKEVDLSILSPGIYYLKAKGNNVQSVVKVVKEK